MSGDARRALEICRRAAELANYCLKQSPKSTDPSCSKATSSKGYCLVRMADIEAAIQEVFQAPHIQIMKTCSRLSKIMLVAMVHELYRSGLAEITFEKVAEKPKERRFASRTTHSSNPYDRNDRNNWFPEGLSSLNRNSSRHSPFTNGHSMDILNLYPTVHPHNGIPGYKEVFGPNSLGRYPRPTSNCLYSQFEPDPLISYHHDGFYHQPACSCLHCCNTHWPSIYNNQRIPYPVYNHGFYQEDGPPMLGHKNYNQRDANGLFNSKEPRFRQRPMFMKKGMGT